MLLGLAACAADDGAPGGNPGSDPGNSGKPGDVKASAYSIYQNATKGLNAVPGGEDTQYDIDMMMDMKMSFGGEIMNMKMSGNIKAIVEDGILKYSSVMDMGELGGIVEVRYDGKDFYTAVNGAEVDVGMDMDMLMAQMEGLPDFEMSAIKSAAVDKKDGGEKTTIVVDGKELSDYAMRFMGGMMDELGGLDYSLDIGNITTVTVTDADGIPKTIDMKFDMSMNMEGVDMDIEYVIKYKINQFGSGVVL
jgi:hypothetical protein